MNLECPVCQNKHTILWSKAKDYEYFTSNDIFDYFHCAQCNTLFLNPQQIRPLDEIYPSNYYAFTDSGDSIIQGVKQFLDKRMFEKILKNISSDILHVLDVGGGTGWLLDIVKLTDSRVKFTQVVDIDDKAQAKALQHGHAYFLGKIEDFETERRFHFVLILNLIEHVSNPLEILHKIEKILMPGGIVLIKTPNIDCWDVRLFKNYYWGGLHAPRHWVMFSEKSFRKIANLANLIVEKVSYTQGAPFWAYSILSKLHDMKLIKITPDKPMFSHILSAPLMALGAALDFCRAPFTKTSQMFIILRKS